MKSLLKTILNRIYWVVEIIERYIFKSNNFKDQKYSSNLSNTQVRDLISSFDEQIQYFRQDYPNKLPAGEVWQQRLIKNFNMLKLQPELIHSFNKLALTGIGDDIEVKTTPISDINPHNRANKYLYNHVFNTLIKNHPLCLELLKKYPADFIGNRGTYRKDGFVLTINHYSISWVEGNLLANNIRFII